MSSKKIVKTWTGYELCLSARDGHFCQKEKGHVPQDHGKDNHICTTQCDHVCNCGGDIHFLSKVWPEPIDTTKKKANVVSKGGLTYIKVD